MAVLGSNGYVRFRREAPEPVLLKASLLRADTNIVQLSSNEFWSGDEVLLTTPFGLPLSTSTCPEGVGCYYGSYWELGSNRQHVTSESSSYYVTSNNSVFFYNRGSAINTATYFISRDQLGRASFYTTRADALASAANNRINFGQLDFNYMVLAAAGTQEYDDAIVECVGSLGEYVFSDVSDEITLVSICDYSPSYAQPPAGTTEYDDAELSPRRWVGGFPWLIQGQLREWSIELNAGNIDTTAVGHKFGENVKSVVSGGGTFDFLVDRTISDSKYDSTSLMQLLLITEKGAKAEAEFFMISDKTAESCQNTGYSLAAGDLYYKCEILITNTALNTRAEEVIAGTAQFVTTGPIELRMGQ